MLHLSARSLLAILFCGAVACSSADAEVTEDADLTNGSPIGPAALVDCWVTPDTSTTDVFYQSHPLTCVSKVPANYPLKPTFVLQYTTAVGKVGTLTERDLAQGAKVMGKLTNKDFPVALKFKASFPSQLDAYAVQSLEVTRKLETVQSTSSDKPASFKSPFSVWYVEFKSPSPASVSAEYSVDLLDGYKTDPNATRSASSKLNVRGSLLTSRLPEVALLAPTSGSIPVRLNNRVAGNIDGPGVYTFDGTALKKESTQVSIGGACGTPNSAPCTTDEGRPFCRPFTNLEGTTCRACGDAGQKPCDAEIACDFSLMTMLEVNSETQTCELCGRDGQPACLIPAWVPPADEPLTCSYGFDFDPRSSSARCFPCGKDGQPGCYNTFGFRHETPRCYLGTTFNAATKKCKAP